MLQLESLRKQIRELIKEVALLNELQRIPSLNDDINEYFKRAKFYLNGEEVMSEKANNELREECSSAVRTKIYQMESGKYNFPDFYIIKLSDFMLPILSAKDNKTRKMKITFSESDVDDTSLIKDISTSFVFFVYNNTIFRFFPYNENFTKDTMLEAKAKSFITSPKFDEMFGSKTQRAKFNGEIVIRTDGTPINIYTEYFNMAFSRKPEQKKEPFKIQQKKTYRKNSPLEHEKFGSGVIMSVKKEPKFGPNAYVVTANFPEFGEKKLMVKTKENEDVSVS